tara:strand:+ start:553 stop:666 length:114 start_codon:yes stop_codon:yes gene_type:complete
MKKKFDDWVAGWSDGTLLIYFTTLAAIQVTAVVLILG